MKLAFKFRIYYGTEIMFALNYRPKIMTVYLDIPLKPLMLSFKLRLTKESFPIMSSIENFTDVCALAKGINF